MKPEDNDPQDRTSCHVGFRFPQWLVKKIDEEQDRNNYGSRSEAARQLLIRALDSKTSEAKSVEIDASPKRMENHAI